MIVSTFKCIYPNFEKKLFKIHTNWPKYKEIAIK